MKLDRLELLEIGLELREPFRISSGEVRQRRILLIRAIDRDGSWGWGECVAGEFPNYSPETIDTAWLAITQWIAPRLLGRSLSTAREVQPLLDTDFQGHQMAKAAVEMAIWELEARRRGIALAQLLGGTRSKIAVGISIGIQSSPDALVERVQAAIQTGYRKIKVKIEPGRDLEYLKATCNAAPGGVVMADANSAYRLEDAGLFQQLDNLRLMMIEQPLSAGDLRRHAMLQRQVQTPLCLDESVDRLERLEDMIALEAGRILNLKPGRVGGLAVSLAMHQMCSGRNLPVWCGGMLESGIGRGHNIALASLPGFTLPGDISPSRRYWARDIVDPEWKMDPEGFITVPFNGVGIGVEIDHERIEAMATRREVVR